MFYEIRKCPRGIHFKEKGGGISPAALLFLRVRYA